MQRFQLYLYNFEKTIKKHLTCNSFMYIPTDNWSKLLSPRQLRVEVGADLHLDDQWNIFSNEL